jgi:AcrR family transcriptional regulator
MSVLERVAERSVAAARTRAEQEVVALVDAALAVLARDGLDGLTVAAVLAEAGLSTRAFYRHFASKDALLLAVYEHETARSVERMRRELGAAAGPRAALEAWVDETLALGFSGRRAARTAPLAAEGARLRHEQPERFAAIHETVLAPLRAVLEQGRADGSFPAAEPEADARSIHAVTWALVEARLAGADRPSRADARRHVLRFVLPALGTAAGG